MEAAKTVEEYVMKDKAVSERLRLASTQELLLTKRLKKWQK